MLEGGVVKSYELVTIQRTAAGSGFEMRLKHFAPDLAGWEEPDETNVWPLESQDENSATFGPVTYTAVGSDRLRATVRMQTGDRHEVARIEMHRKR